jgi:hypothetical protein
VACRFIAGNPTNPAKAAKQATRALDGILFPKWIEVFEDAAPRMVFAYAMGLAALRDLSGSWSEVRNKLSAGQENFVRAARAVEGR